MATREKDREHSDLEARASNANRSLQQAETTLSHLKSDLKAKQHELRSMLYLPSMGSRFANQDGPQKLSKKSKTRQQNMVPLPKALPLPRKRYLFAKSKHCQHYWLYASFGHGLLRSQIGEGAGASKVYAQLLKLGQQKKKCTACNRHLDDAEMEVFQKYVRDFSSYCLNGAF